MKTINSLLALIQICVLVSILFGLFIVDYPYRTSESDILHEVQNDDLREVIKHWHQRTIQLSRQFAIGCGAAIFTISTGVVILLNVGGHSLAGRHHKNE